MTWIDVYLGRFKFYRKRKGGTWFLHEFTKHSEQLTFPKGGLFWATYGEINRYSRVIKIEKY